MTWHELENLVYDVREGYSLWTVHFGCNCGCGGDYWTSEQWNSVWEDFEESKRKLQQFGVTFDDPN